MKKILIASTMAAISMLGTAGLAQAAATSTVPCGFDGYPLCSVAQLPPVPPTTVVSEAPTVPSAAPLPVTGSNSNEALLVGAGVLATGGGLVLVARRRRHSHSTGA